MINSAPQGRNLAGIVPVSGWRNSFGFAWPDYLQPLRPGLLAAERSIYECALAGCDSIWVVCDDNTAPLIKKRIGDYVLSPRYFEEKNFVKRRDYHKKWIPVFYTAVPLKDRNKRDSLGWSTLHGALTAFQVSDKMSQWMCPTKYFVSFPYGIYDPSFIKNHRSHIRGDESFYLSHHGKTVRDGLYLAFTFNPEDWVKFKWHIKNQCTGGNRNVSPEERWSSKNFSLDKIFKLDIIDVSKIVEVEEYYNLESWESLQNFYASNIKIPIPGKQFMKPYHYTLRGENEYKKA